MEIWKDIKGYEGLYQISNLGNVKSLRKNVILKCSKCSREGNYYKAGLYKNGKTKTILVHKLVANAFIPNPNNLPCINHKDENKLNNKADNLEWCTYKQNNDYGKHDIKKYISLLKRRLLLNYPNEKDLINQLNAFYKKL